MGHPKNLESTVRYWHIPKEAIKASLASIINRQRYLTARKTIRGSSAVCKVNEMLFQMDTEKCKTS